MNRPAPSTADIELLQERFARRCVAHLAAGKLPHDITERLRAAREQALTVQRRVFVEQVVLQPATVARGAGSPSFLNGFGALGDWGGGTGARWLAGAALAFIAAVMLLNIQRPARQAPAPMPALSAPAASPLALMDVALVTDPLPPHAYADPGFMHFLRQTATNPRVTPPGEHIIAPATPAPAPASAAASQ